MVNQKGSEYRKKEDLRRFFYPQEWNKFYNALPENSKFYFSFLMQTGARYKELKHVELRDIDFERNAIKIRYAKNRIGGIKKVKITCDNCKEKTYLSKKLIYCPNCGSKLDEEKLKETYNKKVTKRRREIRTVKISEPFKEELKRIKNKNKMNLTDTFNFPSIQALRQMMHKKLKEVGIKDWREFTPHNIRKTHENYLLATGSNPLSLRMHMGHSIDVATAHYISNNIFSQEEIGMIKSILGNLHV